MLVYANHLQFQGAGAEHTIFRAIRGWLKEQLGFGLRPGQMRHDGEFEGTRSFTRFDGSRGEVRSWLRVAATDAEPALYSWVLKNLDGSVPGRQWITELGLKKSGQNVELSCVVKTDERSILAARSPVMASRPRVIGYIVNNIQHAADAYFAPSVDAIEVKSVGEDLDSYRALNEEIGRRDRKCALVIVSPTRDGEYLLNVTDLQEKLIGLGQVVQVCSVFNSYEMAQVIGQQRSAWSGAVNVVFTPLPTGLVRNRLFRSEEILEWGSTQHDRISHLLAWVTNNTNIPRLREHIRREGVMQLALQRRMEAARAKSEHMNAAQLRAELEGAAKQAADQSRYFDELVEENSQLEARISEFNENLAEVRDELAKKEYTIQSLKDRLSHATETRSDGVDAELIVDLACSPHAPSPLQCLDLIEKVYGDRCMVLSSARRSAEEMDHFINGRELMGLLKKLVTEYRSKLMAGGDNQARTVFGKNEYAAKESATVMANRTMRRQRTFPYDGQDVEMFRHLKIGFDGDVTRTIRVHFHWDADKGKVVIGYCGKHLPISSH